ncbi:cofactor assembly of complex C subunit B [Roseofilum sp. BLCC_M91]|uniref:Cofactor assembly of complex C subunit B n=1 Tax=Roseofilum halophilum BLCC-M91 TaxID=3022259 RepID=A0ABT7BSJ9_9CYAN|nr:cofactor assembly of complex C subunit B [Roseofilum halophilum]MDJ1181489.1 cofactor assembly of complex C subunit B [Roseofilum halophilum BLCC-M91]
MIGENPALIPLLILTLLLCIGLFFFIRASVKDRTEEITLIANATEEELLPQLQQYFDSRAYQVTALESQTQKITLEGTVQPSWFLAIFLSFLAALGILCANLVFSTLWPEFPPILWMVVVLAPGAGWFYWKGAYRTEQVELQVQPLEQPTPTAQSLIALKAHRDELAELQKALEPLISSETEFS